MMGLSTTNLMMTKMKRSCCKWSWTERSSNSLRITMGQLQQLQERRGFRIPYCGLTTMVLNVISVLSTHSGWYNVYVRHPRVHDIRFLKKFRRRFRISYPQFKELYERLQGEPMFRRWHTGTTIGFGSNPVTPFPLLCLTSLRYLGRTWTFDDLAENTAISEHVIRDFFHVFIDYGSTTLYYLYVRSPLIRRLYMVHHLYYFAMHHAIYKVDASAPYIVTVHHAMGTNTITQPPAPTNCACSIPFGKQTCYFPSHRYYCNHHGIGESNNF